MTHAGDATSLENTVSYMWKLSVCSNCITNPRRTVGGATDASVFFRRCCKNSRKTLSVKQYTNYLMIFNMRLCTVCSLICLQ